MIFAEGAQLRKIEENAFRKSGLTEVQIPASVRIIGESTFYNCDNLSKVTFTENSQLREIESCAFYNTRLTEIYIPASVQNIGFDAF